MAIEWETYRMIRRMYLVEKKSQRVIARELGLGRKTIRKYCTGKALPETRKTTERPSPLRSTSEDVILHLLEENKTLPRKQQRNAKHIWEHLVSTEGIGIAQSTVREYVRNLRNHHPDVFIPLAHDPGEAVQFDWGDMPVSLNGIRTVVSVFCAALPHSGAILAFVYTDKTMLSFMEGHIQTFNLLEGVPQYCVYDNLKTAVFKGFGKQAVKNKSFERMEAHYAFSSAFCNVASGWEKSSVENAVAIVRSMAFTPMPKVTSYAELQEHVTGKCLQYIREHHIRNHEKTMAEEFAADKAALLPLPGMPLDNGFTARAYVHPDLTVRYENIRYSVPHELVGKQVTLRLSPFHLAIFHDGTEVYRHKRASIQDGHQYVLDHYLQILAWKPRSVDQALPIRKGIMPTECKDFLRLCTEKDARQQLVDILLLGRETGREELLWALQQANNTRFPNFTLVRTHLEMIRTSPDLEGPEIQAQNLARYDDLLEKGGSAHGIDGNPD